MISVILKALQLGGMEVVDRIKLVRPDNQSLFKDTNGLFRSKTQIQAYEADGSGNVAKRCGRRQ